MEQPRRVRLLVFCGAVAWGGAEVALGHLLAGLPDHYEVRLLGVDDIVLQQLAARRPGTPRTVLPRVQGWRDLGAMRTHRRAMAEAGADLLHINLPVPYADPYTVLAASTLWHIPVVAVEHLPMPSPGPRIDRIVRFTARRLRAVVGVSEGAAQRLEEVLGLPSGAARVVRNGVPRPGPSQPVATPPGRLVVGGVGRLDVQKGFDVLVRAVAALPDVHLVLVGDGPERQALDELVADLGVRDRVMMTGWSAEVSALMGSFDVLAVPSRWEGLPLVVLEAMLAGVPVVATPVGGIPDAVRHERTGLLVPVDDPAALTTALERLSADPAHRGRLATEAAAEARRCFTVEAMVQSYMALHDELLSRGPRRLTHRARTSERRGRGDGTAASPPDVDVAAVPVGGPWPVLAPPAAAPVQAALEPPSFSIVIAAYQAEATVAAAIESVLDQTRPPLEVVVCDDGSTDGTADVLAGFGERIRVVRRPNGGESAAKNTAVAAARGDYVVVLDADDVFHPRRLEALAWLAQQRPDLDVLTTDAVVEADGVPVRQAYHADWHFPVDGQRAAILDGNFILGMCAVPRERWLGVGGFDESLAVTADWEFWQRLVLSGSQAGLVDVPLARYRLTQGTLSSDPTRMTEARLRVLDRAAAREDLDHHERDVVTRARERERRELQWRRLERSLSGEGDEALRSSAWAVLVGRAHRPRSRALALLALATPGLARRRRRWRVGDTVEIGSDVRVPRPFAAG
ncbi:glycosyltransferase [Modestobacter excelsi]|uniref:glycosyltransferase n=1 Tax=Modestobacter excelsi TaxID=2213161 RepID=UPI00110CE65B|nr:glycosyltransferase [Modestobacter excelsi]